MAKYKLSDGTIVDTSIMSVEPKTLKGATLLSGGTTPVATKPIVKPAPTSVKTETSAGDLPSLSTQDAQQPTDNLENLRRSLRSAVQEASAERMSKQVQQFAPGLEGSPDAVGMLVNMIKSGTKPAVESVFGDILSTFKEYEKQIQFSPDNFRNVQGGIYDIKNNKWLINPKVDDGGSTKSDKTLSRTDVQKLGLPLELIGTNWTMLSEQLDNSTPPPWFEKLAKNKLLMGPASYSNQDIINLWDTFRYAINGTFVSPTKEKDSGNFDFDDF